MTNNIDYSFLKSKEGGKMIRAKQKEVDLNLEMTKQDLSDVIHRKRGSPEAADWYHDLIIN